MTHGREQGLTLFGFLVVLIVLLFGAMLGMRVVPAYYEHQRIQSILNAMRESGATSDASDLELRASFDRRAQIEDIHSVTARDLSIDKESDGKIVHVEYVAKVPLFEHVYLMIEFASSSGLPTGKH